MRLDRLNTLRGLSILGVFLFHVCSVIFLRSDVQVEQLFSRASYSRLESFGWLLLSQAPRLVAIFFMMSGYFVHRTFLLWIRRNHTYLAFTRFFLWRRFWRLVPPFWCALIFSYLLAYAHPLAWDSLRKLLVNATLLKTLVPGYFFSINYAHWYVAVQWQLDLLYPVFIYIIWRRSFRATFLVACTLAFLTNFVFPNFSTASYVYNLPFRWCLEWALGAALAEAHAKQNRAFSHPLATAVMLILGLGLAIYFNLGLIIWLFSLLALALVLERFLLSRSPLTAVERWLAPVGLWSYSLYLLHVPIIDQCLLLLERRGFTPTSATKILLLFAGSFVLSLAAAALSYYAIEEKSSALGSSCWRAVQRIRESRRAPLFLVRPHVREERQSESIKPTA